MVCNGTFGLPLGPIVSPEVPFFIGKSLLNLRFFWRIYGELFIPDLSVALLSIFCREDIDSTRIQDKCILYPPDIAFKQIQEILLIYFRTENIR